MNGPGQLNQIRSEIRDHTAVITLANASRRNAINAEMWRTLASMERLPPSLKAKLGDALVERLEKDRKKDLEVSLWALGRLGARAPLYGPADAVVSADVARPLAPGLIAILPSTW